jgi:hypothetical protein
MDLIQALPDTDSKKESLLHLQQNLMETYDKLSNQYHTEKVTNTNNSFSTRIVRHYSYCQTDWFVLVTIRIRMDSDIPSLALKQK